MSFKDHSKFQVSNNIVFRKQSDDSYVLLEIEGDLLFELHGVSAFIWFQVSKEMTYAEILGELEDEYEDFQSDEKAEVDEFLQDLIEKKILSIQ